MDEKENRKHYVVTEDVIGRTAQEGVIKLADYNNYVYINLKRIREESDNSKNPLSYQHKGFINWLNEKMEGREIRNEDGRITGIRTALGGIVSWEIPPASSVYITSDPKTKNELLEEGKQVSLPDFLKYDTEPLNSGLISVYENVRNPKNLSLKDLEELTGVTKFFPHQFVLVNRQILYRVDQRVSEVKENSGRYRFTGEPFSHRVDYDFHIDNIIPGFTPFDLEQRIAFYQITHPDTEICLVTGGPSSGKTVVSYAAGLQLVLGNEKLRNRGDIFQGIRVYKSTDIIGGKHREIGFLKGEMEKKIGPWYESWRDTHRELNLGKMINYDLLFLDPEKRTAEGKIERDSDIKVVIDGKNYYFPSRNPVITLGHLPFERGRTFSRVVMLIDEGENLEPWEMWSLLTRAGKHVKIIVHGDPAQVDNPKLSKEFNGLVWLANMIRETDHPRASIIHLPGNFRSQTAELIGGKTPPLIY